MKKKFLFRGSRDRLHRMVQRYGGTFDGKGGFELLWKPNHYKQHHVLTFRISCQYKKGEEGYHIIYRIRPTWFSAVRIAVPVGMLLWVLAVFFPGSSLPEYGAMAALMAFVLLTAFWQLKDSEKEFLKHFLAPTRSQ